MQKRFVAFQACIRGKLHAPTSALDSGGSDSCRILLCAGDTREIREEAKIQWLTKRIQHEQVHNAAVNSGSIGMFTFRNHSCCNDEDARQLTSGAVFTRVTHGAGQEEQIHSVVFTTDEV